MDNVGIRYKEDAYDRMWFPYNIPSSVSINSSFTIDSLNDNEYKLPSTVMKTAMRPLDVNDSLDFELDTGDPSLEFYVYMHFAELEKLQRNQHREFDVELNGNIWAKSIVPEYLHSKTIFTNDSVRGTKLKFSLYRTINSTLPPILNAMEIYLVKDFLQEPTDQEDVNAIKDIKSSYRIVKSWQGDPCEPMRYSWDGLNCSYNGYESPRITSLNLASSGLTGHISPLFSKFTTLEYLDLSNNSLTGEVPDFLSQLVNLRELNLSRNKLSGLVPASLMALSKNSSLTLSLDGNVDLCLTAPCKEEKKKKKNNIVVPLVSALVPSLIILAALIIIWRCKTKQSIHQGQATVVKSHKREGLLKSNNQQFTYSEIVSMTKNFQSLIGKGGFGMVYHGYLNDGTQVAVKMLSTLSNQSSSQFQNEAQLLMRVHHRNLASIIGYCNEGGNMGIVFEYMAYGNLENYLSDKTKVLSWKERLQIAVDAAQGLEYLHHGCKPPIIHRDVKTANILLNKNLHAQLADFGFSKLFPLETVSHLSATVIGTVGYLDPEYYISQRLTEKSDVYSFGIVVLQLITGHPAVIKSHDNIHIVEWVRPILTRGDIRDIVDPSLEGNVNSNSVWKALEIAMACAGSKSIERPTMNDVVVDLKQCLEMANDIRHTWEIGSQTMQSIDYSGANCTELEMGPPAR
ncbi:putative leucine-rich repeat receptor-like protein kinase At2g19210 isoform X2 [Ziziphus jujuba]|uniref:non-specific serine/threonine protein kinase n=1 Tax=Ziziphus jujuba TaxID=326968 RepID=A0A6P4AM76_ZIZJJ|nr:putative leucine-rich repeat receptor-like protein kinase At2g19210 isoform X2 [Ziziphus jujuba]